MGKIKAGYYSAIYFLKTANILKNEKPNDLITMQFFQREENVILAGVNECVELLKTQAFNAESLEITTLTDGDLIQANEPVLKVTGHYYQFGHLEGIIDGILTRQTSIATNCYRVLQAANNKSVIYMNDRSDYYYNQENDGYAAKIGGITNFVTTAQVTKLVGNYEPIGTVPHALIQAFNGDLIAALKAYQKFYPTDKLVALVDYNNDVITDTLQVADAFSNLYAVRVDTSQSLIDKYFLGKEDKYPISEINGVNKHLIRALRQALNKAGYRHIKIIVSSGFNTQKIQDFEKEGVPVDIYGVGESLAKINIGFTGDAVQLNGVDQAKVGRSNITSKRLVKK
ncbi:nicotinate phosphoribosyltransferase [Spiroplasma citri]|uniref:nicotinate phosphoribosyltransferase n=1 Tax=Spiroplasma citri TaxID=2133 RepID=A0AAX3SY59_SPICI|nr:nicotinate phosphoribosyltransferase [Spiroplasma citri]WFG96264.1 nicotinate phosphoribosyltransferase [Spiroplasma citri]WFH00150.1 nicotinate phosphoribosyltransferase [Spiroplasma citri]